MTFPAGRRLQVAKGQRRFTLGPIFWATNAPPPDLLGFARYNKDGGDPTVRSDMSVFLRGLVSEFVRLPLAADDSSERSVYRLPGPGPPKLMQLIRHDSTNGSGCPAAMRSANCSSCSGVAQSCLLASSCTLSGPAIDDAAAAAAGGEPAAAEQAMDACRPGAYAYNTLFDSTVFASPFDFIDDLCQ